jgi:PAS domain S-box-containing protein
MFLWLTPEPRATATLQANLMAGGLNATLHPVSTHADLEAALALQPFELILISVRGKAGAGDDLGDGVAPEALATVQRRCPATPVILLVSPMTEAAAIAALERGATDYVVMAADSPPLRLVPAVRRALAQAQQSQNQQRTEQLLIEQRRLLEKIALGHPLGDCLDALCQALSRLGPAQACLLLTHSHHDTLCRCFTPDFPPAFRQRLQSISLETWSQGWLGESTSGQPSHCPEYPQSLPHCADLANDDRWSADWRALCAAHGILACHCLPITGRDRQPVGVLILCFSKARAPSPWDCRLAEVGSRLASLVLERDRTTLPLYQSEEHFRAIVNQVTVGIAQTDLTGRFVLVNQRYCTIVGYSEAELRQKRMQDITHPDDLPLNTALFQRLITNSAPFEIEKRYRRPDGSVVWVNNSVTVVRDELGNPQFVVAVVLDISERMQLETERQQAELSLLKSEAKYRSLFNAIDEGVTMLEAIYDEGGHVIDCRVLETNPAMIRMTGLGTDIIGQTLRQAIDDIEDQWFEFYNRIVTTGESFRFEAQDPDVEGRWFEGFATPVGGKGSHKIVVVYNDITHRKQVEATLRQSEAQQTFLLKFSDALRPLIDAERIQYQAARVLGEHLQANRVGYAEAQDDDQTLVVICNYTNGVPGIEGRYHYDDYGLHLLQEFKAGRTVVRSDIAQDTTLSDQEKAAHAALDLGATGSVPLVKGGRLVAVMFVHYCEAHPWTAEEIALIEDVAERTWSAVARAWAEVALRDSENRLRMAIESAQLSTWDWNLATDALIWDEGCKAIFGLPPQAESSIDVFFAGAHPDDRDRIDRAVQWALNPASQGKYAIEFRTIGLDDGVERWIAARGQVYFDAAHKPQRFIGTMLNITDQKRIEAIREQMLQREQVARAEAERANRIKDEFLAVLSHELRSPLNPILGWTKLLQTGHLDEAKTAAALATIERNVQLQTQLIDDLLDVAKILRGKLSLHEAPVDLAFVIEAAIDTVRVAAAAKSITLHPHLKALGQVLGDAARLQQIVWNLLSNAIKFTPNGGRVDIHLTPVEHQAEITVTDTGRGISPDFLPHIFESFRQEDASITRQHGGLGLGLAIVYQLAEAHGGTITATSPGENQGTTFSLRLPLLVPAGIPPTPAPPSPPVLILNGLRVLAVDDEPDARDLLTTLLLQYGADVVTVTSAPEALTQIDTFRPHVLVSDIGMPGVDGYTLIEKIRTLPAAAGGTIPALALTAYAREHDSQRAIASGFQRHIAKPLHPEELVEAILSIYRPTWADDFRLS